MCDPRCSVWQVPFGGFSRSTKLQQVPKDSTLAPWHDKARSVITPDRQLAMGHNLWLHFGVDEHPFATYFEGFSPTAS